ncbi:MAG: PQQ-binding-like beta-propeller repeat protein [Planctomycetota bacterium]
MTLMPRRRRHVLARITLAAAVASGAALAGCAGVPSAEKRLESSPVDFRDYIALGYRLDWRGLPFVGLDQDIAVVQPVGGVVAVIETGGSITIIEDGTGRNRATNALGGTFDTYLGAGQVGTDLLVLTDTELFIVDSSTGALTGRESLDRLATTPPTLNGRIAIYGSNDGQIVAHLVGQDIRMGGNRVNGPIDQPAVLIPEQNAVGIASRNGDVLFANADGLRRIGQGRMFGGPGAPLTSGRGLVYIASTDQSLYAFDPIGGVIVWRHRTEYPLRHRPAFHNDRVYTTLRQSGLTAFDASTGDVLWEQPSARGEVVSIRGNRLICWDGDTRTAYSVERLTGDVVETVALPSVSRFFRNEGDPIEEAIIYTTTDAHVLGKFVPAN